MLLPPAPPIPRNKEQQQTAYSNASFWSNWYEQLRYIVNNIGGTINHNDLLSIQGGSATERYHLTATQATDLTDAGDTTLHYHSRHEDSANKNAANGYAGLNASSRTTKGVDTTDDIIIDLATKGLVLKDTQGTPHYWRVTISTLGALTTTDLGTSKP